jgi:LysM repeat protein
MKKEVKMIRPSKTKRTVPWIVAAGVLLAAGGVLYAIRNQDAPDTFSHVPEPEVVETQPLMEIAAPDPMPIPELEGARLAADPETVGPILVQEEEPEEVAVGEQPVVEDQVVEVEKEVETPFTSYTVQEGDTLGDIGLYHNVTVRELLESNEDIEHPNRIYAHQTLAVPEPWELPVIGLFSGIVDVPRAYTVQQGETLSDIAARRGITLEAVLEANPDIDDPNLVTAGDIVYLPAHPANIMPDFSHEEVNGAYIVEENDTLSVIALNHRTSVERILEINHQIEDPNLIFSGQVLALPEPDEIIPVTGIEEPGYVIQPGDTLSEIAVRHGLTVAELAEANNIENPNLIIAGHVLQIPEPAKTETTTEPVDVEGRHYIVREGDTLGEIALRHRKTVVELVVANDIENPNRIAPGQVIVIPEA